MLYGCSCNCFAWRLAKEGLFEFGLPQVFPCEEKRKRASAVLNQAMLVSKVPGRPCLPCRDCSIRFPKDTGFEHPSQDCRIDIDTLQSESSPDVPLGSTNMLQVR